MAWGGTGCSNVGSMKHIDAEGNRLNAGARGPAARVPGPLGPWAKARAPTPKTTAALHGAQLPPDVPGHRRTRSQLVGCWHSLRGLV